MSIETWWINSSHQVYNGACLSQVAAYVDPTKQDQATLSVVEQVRTMVRVISFVIILGIAPTLPPTNAKTQIHALRNIIVEPVRLPSTPTQLSRPKPDTENRVEIITTLSPITSPASPEGSTESAKGV